MSPPPSVEPPSSGPAATGGSSGTPPRKPPYTRQLKKGPPYDPSRRREATRSGIALALVALIAIVALSLVALTAAGRLSIDDAKDLAGVILAPLLAVTGTVFGFYYGGHRDGR